MTTEITASAVQDAAPAQEPSTSVTEVKQTDTPQIEAQPETPEAAKERLAKQQEHFEKRDARQRKALSETQRQLQEERTQREAVLKRLAEYEAKQPLADKPNPDNFDTDDAYADALADWKLAQREKTKAEEVKQPDVEKLADQKAQWKLKEIEFNGKQENFRKENPNYDANAGVVNQFLALANKSDPRFAAFSTVLMNAENPPALINYLGENPKEIMTLFNAATPLDVEFALEGIIEKIGGTISADYEGQPGDSVQTPKALPVPPSGLRPGTTKVNKAPDQMSGRELLNKYMPKGK